MRMPEQHRPTERRANCTVETGLSLIGSSDRRGSRVHPNMASKSCRRRFDNHFAFSCCLCVRIFTKLSGKQGGKGDRCKWECCGYLQVQRVDVAREKRKRPRRAIKLVIAKPLNFAEKDWRAVSAVSAIQSTMGEGSSSPWPADRQSMEPWKSPVGNNEWVTKQIPLFSDIEVMLQKSSRLDSDQSTAMCVTCLLNQFATLFRFLAIVAICLYQSFEISLWQSGSFCCDRRFELIAASKPSFK